jgi:hypothetical protein
MKKSMWSNPEGFSIVDMLALSFAVVFLISAIYIMIVPAMEQIEVLEVLSQPVMVILGGYFGDQIVRGYQQGKIEEKEKVVTDFRDSV